MHTLGLFFSSSSTWRGLHAEIHGVSNGGNHESGDLFHGDDHPGNGDTFRGSSHGDNGSNLSSGGIRATGSGGGKRR